MKAKTIRLKKRRNEVEDRREEYFIKYSIITRGTFKGILQGSPILYNVNGKYIYLDDLDKYCFFRNRREVGQFIRDVHSNSVKHEYTFIWRDDK